MNNVRPWQLLPIEEPRLYDPSEKEPDYFYKNVIKPLINDMIIMMNNGLTIDKHQVEALRDTIDNVLNTVRETFRSNKIIQEFQKDLYKIKYKEYIEECKSKCKTLEEFIPKEFKESNIVHRTYLINTILDKENLPEYKLDKWTINDIKKLLTIEDIQKVRLVLNKSFSELETYINDAMRNLAKDKMIIYNKSRLDDKIANVQFNDLVPEFNAGSSKQKIELFNYLDIEPISLTDSGQPQWNRANIETLLDMTSEDNKDLIEVLQAIIDFSYSAIIRNNFLESFDKNIIDNILYGNIKLLGTLSARPTSSNPNLLQLPSTGSIYAKPLKKCIVAPEGYMIWTIDFSALEERVLANLSKDKNKCSIFLNDLDSHCFNALGYFSDEIGKHIELVNKLEVDAKTFKKAIDNGNDELKAIRQKSKPINFKLNYLGMADSDKGGFITQEIYDAYHNTLYKEVGNFREEMKGIAKRQGYVHLGLGFRLYVDDIDKQFRSVFNAYGGQFWSILTLIAINELHYRLKENNLIDNIKVNATIYDAIYGIVKKDSETIKWLNDNIVEIMTKDFLKNQIVKNEANLEIGTSWSSLIELQNNTSIEDIDKILKEI